MHIKQLELYGFKSFVDRTVISFPTGICAVVGPNGCGKSNIVDAIRWVLGEQSAKQLRGKHMEEVIFSGANGRPSLNFSEVSLILSNEEGRTPPPYHQCSEIMVTRRLFRSGESEYLINKVPCRRMDVTRLFMDAGVGHRHYAIIEQGKIGHVVESKPDDIRALIEEAAGITRYKLKKKAALRKIELTQHNLLRLGDIIAEVSRQITTLQRQAWRANRYRSLKKEIKRLEIKRALHQYQQWREQLEALHGKLRDREDTQSARTAELARVEAELVRCSGQVQEREEALQRKRQELFELKNSINKDETNLAHGQRRLQDLEDRRQRLSEEIRERQERLQQLAGEREALAGEERQLTEEYQRIKTLSSQANEQLSREKARLNELKETVDGLKADLVDLMAEAAGIRNQILATRKRLEEIGHRRQRREQQRQELAERGGGLRPRIQDLEGDISSSRAEIQRLEEEAEHLRRKEQELEQARQERTAAIRSLESSYHQQQSQLQVLTEMERSYAWFSQAVKALMKAREKGELECRFRGVVAEMLEVDAPYRQAVEAALGDRLQAVVVDSPLEAVTAVDYLKQAGAGRHCFIPRSLAAAGPETAGGDAEGPPPLASLVRARPGYESLVRFLLEGIFFCTDLREALDWWEARSHACTLVTPEGDLVGRDGTLAGGSRQEEVSILEKQEEKKVLEREVSHLRRSLEDERRRLKEMDATGAQVTTSLRKTENGQQQLRSKLLEQEKELYRLQAEEQKISDHLSLLAVEKEQDEEEAAQRQAEQDQGQQELQSLDRRRGQLEEDIAEAKSERQEVEGVVDGLQEQATGHQVSLGTLAEKRESARSNRKRLEDYHAEEKRRLRQLEEEQRSCQQQQEELLQEEQQTRDRLDRAHHTLGEQESRLQVEEDSWRRLEADEKNLETRRAQLLQEEKQGQQEIQSLHQEISELNLKIQYLCHQVQERYQQDLESSDASDMEESPDLGRLEARLQRLRDQVSRIGEVNLTAIQEYEEQKQRHDFLTAQRDDLAQSLEGLKKAISRINKTTRNRFLKTLDALNRKLAEVFPLLFNGGSGHLRLVNEREPLESGVEILAHPPGKRLTSMSLLSGGEKALAAVALLFSLYMIRPSPFCILDEVDTALDEPNIDRFNQLLQAISGDSQIIMITHNKRSMEMSDLLLGVTMEEPGISTIMSVNFAGVQE